MERRYSDFIIIWNEGVVAYLKVGRTLRALAGQTRET
jgi:hypothetical protein